MLGRTFQIHGRAYALGPHHRAGTKLACVKHRDQGGERYDIMLER